MEENVVLVDRPRPSRLQLHTIRWRRATAAAKLSLPYLRQVARIWCSNLKYKHVVAFATKERVGDGMCSITKTVI